MQWANVRIMYFGYSLIIDWNVARKMGDTYTIYKANYFGPMLITILVNSLFDFLFDRFDRSIAIALCIEIYLDYFTLFVKRFQAA